MDRRIDPEPITIIAATAAIVGGSITALRYVEEKTKDTPSESRRKVRNVVMKLGVELERLKADIAIIENIFRGSVVPRDRVVRLGNGALLSPDDFNRYMAVSDKAFGRLRKINGLTLRAERAASRLTYLDQKLPARYVDEGLDALEDVLRNRNLAVEEAWVKIRRGIDSVTGLIENLEEQID